jgi:hypothetical protein
MKTILGLVILSGWFPPARAHVQLPTLTPHPPLSTKHALALTNRGGATATELLALAREIRAAVEARFGVPLAPEPVLINCTL